MGVLDEFVVREISIMPMITSTCDITNSKK
jgi:hypothetical protein